MATAEETKRDRLTHVTTAVREHLTGVHKVWRPDPFYGLTELQTLHQEIHDAIEAAHKAKKEKQHGDG